MVPRVDGKGVVRDTSVHLGTTGRSVIVPLWDRVTHNPFNTLSRDCWKGSDMMTPPGGRKGGPLMVLTFRLGISDKEGRDCVRLHHGQKEGWSVTSLASSLDGWKRWNVTRL